MVVKLYKKLFFLSLLSIITLSAEVIQPFEIRYQKNVNGNIEVIGNTLLTAPKLYFKDGQPEVDLSNDKLPMKFVSIDKAKRNSSSATLSLKEGSKVLFAGLYWGARSNNSKARKSKIEIKVPKSGYQKIAAGNTYSVKGQNYYSAFADVTSLIEVGGDGVYTIANVDALTGPDCFAGWAMVIVYENSSLPLRSMTIFDGYAIVPPSVDIVAKGFNAPKEGLFSAYLSAIAFEGDMQSAGDALMINGTVLEDSINSKENFFNSRISKNGVLVTEKNPNYTNQLGFDIKQMDVTGLVKNGDTEAKLSFITDKDYYQPVALAFVTDYDTDIAHLQSKNKKGPHKHGEIIHFTSKIANKQGATVYKAKYITDLLGSFDYVKNSMKLNGKLLKTKVDGNILEATIDKISAESNVTIEFDLQIKSPAHVSFGSNLNIQSGVNYFLEELGVKISVPSDNNKSASQATPTPIKMAYASKSLKLMYKQSIDKPAPYAHHDTLTVSNEFSNLSKLSARNCTFTNLFPNGVDYIPNSLTLNGKAVETTFKEGLLSTKVGTLRPEQSHKITFQIKLGNYKKLPFESITPMAGSLNYEVSNSGVKSAIIGSMPSSDGTTVPFKLAIVENIKLKLADKLYADGNYTGSTPLYDELFFSEMASMEYNHKLAKSAHRAEDYDSSLAAYERLLILDERPMYSFEMAQLYIDMEMLGDAKILVLSLKDLSTDEKEQKRVLLEQIEDKRDRHNFTSVLKVGMAYDDNLNASPGTTTLEDYYTNELNSTVPSSSPVAVGDTYIDALAVFISQYDVGKRSKFYFKNALTVMNNRYLSESNYDVLFGKLSLGLGYLSGRYNLVTPVEVDHIVFGGASLINSYALAPTLNYRIAKNMSVNILTKFQQKQYIASENSSKDTNNIIVGGSFSFKKPATVMSVNYRYQLAQKVDSDSNDTYLDYTAHTLGGSYSMNFKNRMQATGSFTLRLLSYSDTLLTSTDERFDTQSNLKLGFSKRFFNKLKASLNYVRATTSSNFTLLSYEKNKYKLSFQMTF